VTKIKKDLITKAKVKKQYAKVKAEHQKQATATPSATHDTNADPTDPQNDDESATAPAQIHPERQAMLDAPSSSRPPRPNPNPNPRRQQPSTDASTEADDANTTAADLEHHNPTTEHEPQPYKPQQQKRPRKQNKPDYYTKELATAERVKKQAEERAAEFARRDQERQSRIAERERYRKAMAKAKTPGRDGKPKVGRESKLLLERVMRIVGN
jgi:hypothetical protein